MTNEEMNNETNEIKYYVEKYYIQLAPQEGKISVGRYNGRLPTGHEKERILALKPRIIEYLKEQQRKAEEQRNKYEEERKRMIEDIKKNKIKIHISMRINGEGFPEYTVNSDIAGILETAHAVQRARYANYVSHDVVEALGQDFYYADLLRFRAPLFIEIAKKKKQERLRLLSKIKEAKETGKPVLLYHYVLDECLEHLPDCSFDTVYHYVDGSGKEFERAIHNY